MACTQNFQNPKIITNHTLAALFPYLNVLSSQDVGTDVGKEDLDVREGGLWPCVCVCVCVSVCVYKCICNQSTSTCTCNTVCLLHVHVISIVCDD